MPVRVGVRLACRVARRVAVAMMLVVDVAMLVVERLVAMLVLVPLGEMQRDTDRHQHAGDAELPA